MILYKLFNLESIERKKSETNWDINNYTILHDVSLIIII